MHDGVTLVFLTRLQREKHFVFEDPKSSSSDGSATSAAAQEWLEAVERGREIAISQSMTASYTGDEAFRDLQTSSSSAHTLDRHTERHTEVASTNSSRHTLHKYPSTTNPDDLRGGSNVFAKRFSKRQSKSGLAAVF
jgi:3-phosphoinositide dependent protein kinase-1